MKINEITDENKTWAVLKDFNFDEIVQSFEIVDKVWPIILNSKSSSLIEYHKRHLMDFINQIELELQELKNFPDQEDPDLLTIQETLVKIGQSLTNLIEPN
jgi:hypothetical protein